MRKKCREIFGKIHKKKFVQESFKKKFVGSWTATLFKKRLLHMCFPVKSSEQLFNKTPVNS